jgi:hypothetical protein
MLIPQTMRKVILCVIIVLSFQHSLWAQVSSSYAFTQGAGAFTELTALYTEHAAGTTDDEVFLSVPLGFTFLFNQCPYTTVGISSNGFISFGSTITTGNQTPLSTGAANNVISALGADLQGLVTGSIRSKLTGTSPNQKFTVQWLHYEKFGGADDYSFQIVLCETSNVIEIYYSSLTFVTLQSYEVGLRGASSADFNIRRKAETTAWTSSNAGAVNTDKMITGATAARNPNGRFTWTPPVWSSDPLGCNSVGNVVIFSNYDGSGETPATRLNINVDVNIPNLKIGICSYERVSVNIAGAFVGNVTKVIYAGYNAMGNNHCGSVATTVITGVPAGIITYNIMPPATCPDPDGNNLIICGYQCNSGSQGGCNTPAQVVCYFLSAFGSGSVLQLYNAQYGCWAGVTKSISAGGSCCPPPLPVELLSFNASSPDNKTVLTEWISASETNNDFFTIERSHDAMSFEAVGQVKGAGNSNTGLAYSFVDDHPLSGISYYRLRQTDFDGKFSFSGIVAVALGDGDNPGFTIFPNPASTVLNCMLAAAEGTMTISITDIAGKILISNEIDPHKEPYLQTFDISGLSAGFYFVKLTCGTKNRQVKLVKE